MTPPGAESTTNSGRQEAGRVLLLLALAYFVRRIIIDVPTIMRGPMLWLGLGAFAVAIILAFRHFLVWLSISVSRPRRWDSFVNVSLVVGSITLSVVAMEFYVDFIADDAAAPSLNRSRDENAGADRLIATGRSVIVLPGDVVDKMHAVQATRFFRSDWHGESVTVPGAASAFRWHGVLHIKDRDGFRRLDTPFPPKQGGRARVVVVGDSMTYGYGTDAQWAYPRQIEAILSRQYDVEVLNLGVIAYQSEDIARVVQEKVRQLQPDIVVYGICLNDFLPTGIVERNFNLPGFPLPVWIKDLAASRTRLGRIVDDAYQPFLIQIGVGNDFYDDVLKDMGLYGPRFLADLRRMDHIVRGAGIGPIVGMVLDPHPTRNGRGHRLARMAEAAMRNAGFDVITVEDYYKTYDGLSFGISKWDWHPNEEGLALFATMIANHLMDREELVRSHRRDSR